MSSGPGLSRARYRGPLGATRREHVHYACACGALHSVEVVVAVDSQSDPLLARRMRDGDGSFNTTVCPDTRVRAQVEVPVVYHDPLQRLFVLVLPESARTRELRERAALLLRLADDAEHAVPHYVMDFAVAYGPAGLRRTIEGASDRVLRARRAPTAPLHSAAPPPPAVAPLSQPDAESGASRSIAPPPASQPSTLSPPPAPRASEPSAPFPPASEPSASFPPASEPSASFPPASEPSASPVAAPPAAAPSAAPSLDGPRASEASVAALLAGPPPVGPSGSGWTIDWPPRPVESAEESPEPASEPGVAAPLPAPPGESSVVSPRPEPPSDSSAGSPLPPVPALAVQSSASPLPAPIFSPPSVLEASATSAADPDRELAAGQAPAAPPSFLAPSGAAPLESPPAAQDDGDDADLPAGDALVVSLIDSDPDEPTTAPVPALQTLVSPPPAGAEPAPAPDQTWPEGRADATCGVTDGGVQLSVRASGGELAMLSSPDLGLRLQLHRMPSYPVVTIALGSAAALAGDADAVPPRWIPLHVGHDGDAAVLRALARSFEIELEVIDRDAADGAAPVARARLAAPLADNAAAVQAAAADYLKGIPSERRSFARGLSAFEAADHDRLGVASSHAAGLKEEVLDALDGPAEVLRACAVVKRFSQPSGEDWLIMVRSYPLIHWQAKRRAAVARAVELGIWPGPVGAQIAVADGLARSRKDLVMVLQHHFAATLARPTHGLDDGAVRDNWKALKAEARALGMPVGEWSQPRRAPIMSESEPVASGTIGDPASISHSDLLPALGTSQIIVAPTVEEEGDAAPADGLGTGEWAHIKGRAGRPPTARRADLAHLELAELLVRLRIRERRHAAAIELCRRAETGAMEQVFRSIELMTRGEASRVLAIAIQFGRAAEPHFLAALRSRKSFVHQGAAFALAVTRGEAGVEAACDLLLDEASEMWREIARALGEAGTAAIMPLAARLAERTDDQRERTAWALAHVAARGARRPIETLAAGRDPVAAAVARRALELAEDARGDDLSARSDKTPRDQALHRAFSRRFLDTLRAERRAVAEAAAREAAGRGIGTTSGPPPVLLDGPHRSGASQADGDGEAGPDADDSDTRISSDAEAGASARGGDRAPS